MNSHWLGTTIGAGGKRVSRNVVDVSVGSSRMSDQGKRLRLINVKRETVLTCVVAKERHAQASRKKALFVVLCALRFRVDSRRRVLEPGAKLYPGGPVRASSPPRGRSPDVTTARLTRNPDKRGSPEPAHKQSDSEKMPSQLTRARVGLRGCNPTVYAYFHSLNAYTAY
jgi:hypothetical protein